jgi:DNA repair exonuclease SbcCD ATPase subunit
LDKSELLEQLKVVLKNPNGSGGVIEKIQECPSTDLVLRTPCYVAFFAIERAELLAETYRHAEAEIIGIVPSKAPAWPRDINLVLLVSGEDSLDPAVVREIVDDHHVCRKYVLEVANKDMLSVMAELPFGPLRESLKGESISVAAGVQEALRGYDPRLIADLASHSPGVGRISERIMEGLYDTVAIAEGKAFSPLTKTSAPFARLRSLEIKDFRGIRRLSSEDMILDADVTFVYGPNGVGKTSIADAVEWAITGQIDRLEHGPTRPDSGDHDPIVNVFSADSEAHVAVNLKGIETISRVKRGRAIERRIEARTVADDRAIIEHIVRARTESAESRLKIERLRSLFRGSHKLSQHDIRQFLEGTTATERFDILTTMIGADEYVRFREKASSVAKHVRSLTQDLSEQLAREERDLQDATMKLVERQKEYERLGQLIAMKIAPNEIASELVKGLRACGAIESTDDASRLESVEGEFEVLAAYADTLIRRKKATVEESLVRLRSLQRELPGFIEARSRCDKTRDEIAISKRVAEVTQAKLTSVENRYLDAKTKLRATRSKQTLAARRHTDLVWLSENLPILRDKQEALRAAQESLVDKRLELRKAEQALEAEQRKVDRKRSQAKEAEETTIAFSARAQAIEEILARLPEAKKALTSLRRFRTTKKLHDEEIKDLKRGKKEAQLEAKRLENLSEELQRTYDAEAAQGDVLNAFLAKLGELVRTAECPLCGRRFSSKAAAREGIKRHLSKVSTRLKDLARQLKSNKTSLERNKATVISTSGKIGTVMSALEEVQSNIETVTKTVQDFLTSSTALGIRLSTGKAAMWHAVLSGARKETKATSGGSDAAMLRRSLRITFERVARKEKSCDVIRRRLGSIEKQRKDLVTTIRAITTETTQRNLGADTFTEDGQLADAISQAQSEVRERSGLLGEAEEQAAAIQSTLIGLRERLAKANEDTANSEMQLRQYETICSSYITRCQAIDVDTENVENSIAEVVTRVNQMNEMLADLEERRKQLDNSVSLERLKRDTVALSQIVSDIEHRADSTRKDESRMSQWVSSLEGLEKEVVTRQIDVMGNHLQRLEPIAQQLYKRLNAHPMFGNVRIKVNEHSHGLEIEASTTADNQSPTGMAVSPSAFFSDAQMNSLAITIFLAGALSQQWSRFGTILIDDPIQQMDEMNVFAFLDLLRGLSSQRQFIVFTCSKDFYLLALEKLNCLNEIRQGSFRGYRLEGVAPASLRVHCDAH